MIPAKDLKPIDDAVMIYSEKYGNSFCPVKKVEIIEKKVEAFLIELEEDIKYFAFDIDNNEKFKIFNNGENSKTLVNITTDDFIKVNDFYKKIVSKFETKQNIHLAVDYQDNLYFANNILTKN